jgi:hypothetical protein
MAPSDGGGLIGYVEHVNGPGAQPIENCVATRHELELIRRYWVHLAMEYDADVYVYQQTCSRRGREADYAWRRVSKLAAAIGDEFIERVCSEDKRKLGDLDKRHAQYCAEMEALAEAGE